MQDACKGCLQASTEFAGDPFRRFVRDFEGVADRSYRSIAGCDLLQALPLASPVGYLMRTPPQDQRCALALLDQHAH